MARVRSDVRNVARSSERYDYFTELGEFASPQSTLPIANFLQDMHNKSLRITDVQKMFAWQQPSSPMPDYDKYQMLVSKLPDSTVRKFDRQEPGTLADAAGDLAKLVNKHSGEIVEIVPAGADRLVTNWELHLVTDSPGSASAALKNSQFFYLPSGKGVWSSPAVFRLSYDFGRPKNHSSIMEIDIAIKEFASEHKMKALDLAPDWQEQTNRLAVPCRHTLSAQWRRAGLVTTLGQLFLALGARWTGAVIYEYYRTLRVVALCRKKTGSAVAAAGLSGHQLGVGLGAPEPLVQAYCDFVGEEVPMSATERQAKLAEAWRHIFALILQDLRPPWAEHAFPQGLPNARALGRYTRPSFLHWTADAAMHVFGDEVCSELLQQTRRANKSLGGVVARPLYVCTSMVDGISCGRDAAMSSLFEMPKERGHWHCPRCASLNAPSSASADAVGEKRCSRSLLLYPLVEMNGVCKPVPMRSLSCRVYVHAPPGEFSLSVLNRPVSSLVSSVHAGKSKPAILQSTGKRSHFLYNGADSVCIWMSASSWQGIWILS